MDPSLRLMDPSLRLALLVRYIQENPGIPFGVASAQPRGPHQATFPVSLGAPEADIPFGVRGSNELADFLTRKRLEMYYRMRGMEVGGAEGFGTQAESPGQAQRHVRSQAR